MLHSVSRIAGRSVQFKLSTFIGIFLLGSAGALAIDGSELTPASQSSDLEPSECPALVEDSPPGSALPLVPLNAEEGTTPSTQAVTAQSPARRIDLAGLFSPTQSLLSTRPIVTSRSNLNSADARNFDFATLHPNSLVPANWRPSDQIDTLHFERLLAQGGSQANGSGGPLNFISRLLSPGQGASLSRRRANSRTDEAGNPNPSSHRDPSILLASDITPVIQMLTAQQIQRASSMEGEGSHLRGVSGARIAERLPLQATGVVALARILDRLAEEGPIPQQASDLRLQVALRTLLMRVAVQSGALSTRTVTLTQSLQQGRNSPEVVCHQRDPQNPFSQLPTAVTYLETIEDGASLSNARLFEIFQSKLREVYRNSAIQHCRVPTRLVRRSEQEPRREAADPAQLGQVTDVQLSRWFQADLGAQGPQAGPPRVAISYSSAMIHDSRLTAGVRELMQEEQHLANRLGMRRQQEWLAPAPMATPSAGPLVYQCPGAQTGGFRPLPLSWQSTQIALPSIPESLEALSSLVRETLDGQAKSQARAWVWNREKRQLPRLQTIRGQLESTRDERLQALYDQVKHPALIREMRTRWVAVDFSGSLRENFAAELRTRLSDAKDRVEARLQLRDCSGANADACTRARRSFVMPTIQSYLQESHVQAALRAGHVTVRPTAESAWTLSLSSEYQPPNAAAGLNEATQSKILQISLNPEFARTVERQLLTFATVTSQAVASTKRLIFVMAQDFSYQSYEASPELHRTLQNHLMGLEDAFLSRETALDLFTRVPLNGRARGVVEALFPEEPAFWTNPYVNPITRRFLGYTLGATSRYEVERDLSPTPGIVPVDAGGMAVSSTLGRVELLGQVSKIDVATALSLVLALQE